MMKKFIIAGIIITVVVGILAFGTRNSPTPLIPINQADILTNENSSLIGTWQSVDDEKFIREFTATTYTDRYGEEITATGSWRLFDGSDAPPRSNQEFIPGVLYLTLDEGDPLDFMILTKNHRTIELMNLNRGNVLRFKHTHHLE